MPEVGSKGRYVYCIIRSDQPLTFGPIGIGDDIGGQQQVRQRLIAQTTHQPVHVRSAMQA